jgi:uncharacterized protein
LVIIITKIMILRKLESVIREKLSTGKAIVLLGPRQTGKTTLIEKIISQKENCLMLNCDDSFIRNNLQDANTEQLKAIIGNHKMVFIDEAQRVKNIGLVLKLITDQFKEVKLVVTGSSSLEIMSEINEPLTGRKWEYMLYPISWEELYDHSGYITMIQQLEQRMIFGMYPDVINNPGGETEILKQLSGSYLYKDLLAYKGIRKPEILEKLLRALAFQVGNLVSYNELANLVQVDKNTISNYIDLLEKTFVVFKLQPLSRNLRNEISASRKIYFYDNGIRNALLNNFLPLEYRTDTGALWENFLISERIKFLHYDRKFVNLYFWRTHQQQEIDLIEESNGIYHAYEFKWGKSKHIKIPISFSAEYNCDKILVINKDSFMPFLGIGSNTE